MTLRSIVLCAVLAVPALARAQDECANVLLVVDRSESMKRIDEDATPRWDEVSAAVELIVTSYSDGVRFGLALFPGNSETEQCPGNCEPGDVVVEVGGGTGDAILAAMAASPRCQTTPTGATLEALVAYAQGAQPLADPDRANYIVLVTDGANNCPLGDPVRAAGDLLDWGVETYVVGFDFGEVDALAVNSIASAGGTGEAIIASSETLQAAFDEILGDVYRDPEFGCQGAGDTDVDTDSDTDTETDTDTDTAGDGDDETSDTGSCGCGVAGPPGAGLVWAIAIATVLRRRQRAQGHGSALPSAKRALCCVS